MNTLLLGALVPYVLIMLATTRILGGHFAWHVSDNLGQKKPDSFDWTPAMVGALVLSALWPLILIAYFILPHIPSLPKIGAEREAEKRQMRERIEH